MPFAPVALKLDETWRRVIEAKYGELRSFIEPLGEEEGQRLLLRARREAVKAERALGPPPKRIGRAAIKKKQYRRDKLRDLIEKHPKKTNGEIARLHNKNWSRVIGKEPKLKATAKTVADVRYEMKKREQTPK